MDVNPDVVWLSDDDDDDEVGGRSSSGSSSCSGKIKTEARILFDGNLQSRTLALWKRPPNSGGDA